jgi:hypothetical protein
MDPCSICFEELDDSSATLNCSHIFHKKCVERWFLRAATCPMCRAAVPTGTIHSGELGEIPVLMAYDWDELMENFDLQAVDGGRRLRLRRRWSDIDWETATQQSVLDYLFL